MRTYPNAPPIILFVLSFLSLIISHSSLVAPGVTEASGYDYKNTTHHYYYCRSEEREALLRFKHDVDDSCGLLSSWGLDHHDDCCQWHGVRCSSHTGHVIGLHLGGTSTTDSNGNAYCNEWCLQGKVSPSLVKLKYLKYLDLSCNNFGHPIPNFLGSLPNLKHLHLSSADFVGEIPHQLGNLSVGIYASNPIFCPLYDNI